MEKETVQEIIETLEMRRDQMQLDSEKDAPNTWKDYLRGVANGYDSAIKLIKEYLENEEGGEI